ncbi:NHL repeat-containing protein [Rugamonas rivuli]|uniref:NHL repeat-containing protein n=1 Tax=Rugamonas rivuli TaxID=2743358 RepID=A0A843S4K9_9BURK|nr:hypothetical protein [Rugamonas rivuli]MQA19235.1 hypothetical protein [Rugamonas rivuli]
MQSKLPLLPLSIAALCALGGCGGSGGDNTPPAPVVTKYAIGGTVTGLPAGAALTLTNGGDSVDVPTSGNFTFPTTVPAGTAYAAVIKTQSASATCKLENGSGTVGSAAVNNIAVKCAPVLLATLPFTPAPQFAADYQGNVYLADTGQNAIRKLSPSGVLTLHAGGAAGAPLTAPNAVGISRSGLLRVIDQADDASYRFRIVGLDGVVNPNTTKLAGLRYNWIAASAYEELAAVDQGGASVMRLNPKLGNSLITRAEVASLLAGTQGSAANYAPASVVYGNETDSVLYIADSGNSVIYKLVPQGGSTVFAGIPGVRGAADGAAGTGSLNLTAASALAMDEQGNLYVSGSGAVRKIAPNGTLSTPQLAWGTPALASIAYAKPMLYGRVQNTVIQTYLP